MDYELLRSAFIVIVAVTLYGAIARGLFKATEQPRWRALEISERLFAVPGFPDSHRRTMLRCLDEVHRSPSAWKIAFMMLLVAVQTPFKRKVSETSDAQVGISADLRGDHARFMNYWIIATLGNSPAAALLFVLLGLFLLACSGSISALSKHVVAQFDRHAPVRSS